jgi:hypothetical protein
LTDLAKRIWTWTYMTGAVATLLALIFLVGCVDVGSTSGGATSDADATGGSSTQTQEQTPAE